MLNHLDFCSLDNHLVEHYAIRHTNLNWAHIYYRQLKPTVTSHLLYFIVNCFGVISGSGGFNDELALGRVGSHLEFIVCTVTHIPTAFLILVTGHSVDNSTIGTHESYKHTIRTRLRLSIDDVSTKLNLLLIFLCILSVRESCRCQQNRHNHPQMYSLIQCHNLRFSYNLSWRLVRFLKGNTRVQGYFVYSLHVPLVFVLFLKDCLFPCRDSTCMYLL